MQLKWEGRPLDTPERDIEAIENLTLDDVRRGGREYLHPDGLVDAGRGQQGASSSSRCRTSARSTQSSFPSEREPGGSPVALEEALPGEEEIMSGRTAMVALLAAACLLALGTQAPAATYLVRANGSGDYATIQAALDAVVDTDIIELANGTYDGAGNRDIDFLGKAVTVRSQSGDPTAVTIDCEGSQFDPHRGFWFHSGEGSSSVLQDITVVNGYIADGNGGAVLIEGARPTITGCVFGSNIVDGENTRGGAIYSSGGTWISITGCRFVGNTADDPTDSRGGAIALLNVSDGEVVDCVIGPGNYAGTRGGGVYVAGGNIQFSGCTITDNAAPTGGGIYYLSGTLGMDGCSVYWNEAAAMPALGGGLAVFGDANITGSTFMGNFAAVAGGGLYFSDSAGADVTRCIVAYSLMGGGIHLAASDRSVMVACCDVYDNTGGNYTGELTDQTGMDDNISEEPQFCDAPSGDLTLYNTSPCAPGYSPCGQLIGANVVDCLSPVESSSWGEIKSNYR